ncbi:MAG: hypothetical protein D6736_20340 [Nitrospinota bacterium]|nr:MAG: hypothetical protein D6736_20340 [Nitrospinota bacterium]
MERQCIKPILGKGKRMPIRLVVIDIDGCLTPGEGRPLSLAVLRFLARCNRQAQQPGADVPAVTLCTGRPAPYVELMVQAIAGFWPALYEHGAGMFDPRDYTFHPHPAMTPVGQDGYFRLKTLLTDRIVRQGFGYLQPGKEHSFTLYPGEGITTERLARELSCCKMPGFVMQVGRREINILPCSIDKGVGVEWLATRTACPLEAMAGVGDTTGDLLFLQRVGFAAAPSNALSQVKAQVDYVSPWPDGRGVVDILKQCIIRNRTS